jgi:hypothetical protein
LGTPEAIKVLGNLSPLTQGAADTGATGALAKKVMADNPGMTFSDALAQVQTGCRKWLRYDQGVASPIAGYGLALGRIGGQEAYGTKLGELGARKQREPDVIEAIEAARIKGSGSITEREKLARREKEGQKKAARSIVSSAGDAKNINTVIDKALGQADIFTTGFMGGVGSYVKGTPQFDLAANLKTIEADAAFDRLQQMRDSSKTGGALGQVSERELALLGAARAALEQGQSPEQFRENLTRYKEVRNNALRNVADAYKEDYGDYPKGFDAKALGGGSNTFTSEADVLKANLPKGTEIIINGRRAVIE